MQPPRLPTREAARLGALRTYDLFDSRPEEALNDLTAIAAEVCQTPISLISLIDERREWFKANIGMPLQETERSISFGGHTILEPGVFVVPDASLDERFADNPLVTGGPRIRFYAGAPLLTPDGHAIGTLCVMDRVPRQLTTRQRDVLPILGRQVMVQLELRRHAADSADRASASRRLAAIVESSEDAIVGKDLNGIVSSWNKGAEQIFGYTADEIIGTPILRIIPPERRDEEELILSKIRRSQTVEHFETVRLAKSGRLLDVSITTSPIKDANGVVIGASKVARDITGRKRERDALRDSELRYRVLFDYAPDGILIADSRGVYLDANQSMCEMLGYTREELVGLSAVDIVSPAEVSNIEPAVNAIQAGKDHRRQWIFRRKDGSTFAADVLGTSLPDGNILGMVRDVTERNEATEALRAAEERMRFALDSAQIGIWDMDYATGLLRWSEILEAQYGLAPGTFDGRFETYIALIHPADREATLETIREAITTGQDFTVQYRAQLADGTTKWLTGAGRILLDPHGRPLRGVGISLDVTARHTLEAQYQRAQKMEAIGRLAGGVAHDFNNLLTIILGYSQLLLRKLPAGDPGRQDVSEIQKAGASAAALTRQLLAFSRKEIIEPTLLNLNSVLGDMREMLSRLIGEDVDVVFRLRPDLALVKADRGQMEQVVMNLTVNARDAMPDGGEVTIETANVELDANYASGRLAVQPGSYVVLTVSDTGTGIAPDVQSHLFEPFFTTKDRGKGTGLGLATVHGIITQNGGNVNVYSEVGKGSSFKVYLPAAQSRPEPVEAGAIARPRMGALTVLLVEDADALRELARRLLHELGHTVIAAANADEAVRLFGSHDDVDLILTDVVMPGLSGPDLVQRLRADRPSLRVVYMSGYTEDAIVHRGVLDPGVVFLHKPFTVEALDGKLRAAMTR